MDGRGIDSLYADMETPFSPAEENAFVYSSDSHVKGVLQRIFYYNRSLIRRVKDWQNYLAGQGAKPSEDLANFLIPGWKEENPERKCYNDLTNFFSDYPHGGTPRFREVCDAVRSEFTLFRNLASLHGTEHLKNAKIHYGHLVRLIGYKGAPMMLQDEFARRIVESRDNFLDERRANAMEIGIMLSSPKRMLPGGAVKSGAYGEELPLSVRQDEVRKRAVSLIKGYRRETGCTNRAAIEVVRKALWKEFDACGLKSAQNNFNMLLYTPKFRDGPPADEDALKEAHLDLDV